MRQNNKRGFNHAIKYTLLLFFALGLFWLSGCDASLDDFETTPSLENTSTSPVEQTTAPLLENTSTLPAIVATATLVENTSTPPAGETSWPTIVPAPGDFDYYVLALSWAPDYCAGNPGDTQECSVGRKYAFVLHGLWPQYTTGYPSDCGGKPMPASVKKQFAHLYPNDKLFDHEWDKHGTCSGLSPATYLAVGKQLKEQVQIPDAYRAPVSAFRTTVDALKQAFLLVNPAFSEASLAVNCSGSGRYLKELYVCFSKDGQPAACGADVQKTALKSCGRADFTVRNVR